MGAGSAVEAKLSVVQAASSRPAAFPSVGALSCCRNSFCHLLVMADHQSQRETGLQFIQVFLHTEPPTQPTAGLVGVTYPGNMCSYLEDSSDQKPGCMWLGGHWLTCPVVWSSLCLKLP